MLFLEKNSFNLIMEIHTNFGSRQVEKQHYVTCFAERPS